MHKQYLNALFSMLFNDVYHNSIRHLMCLMSRKIMYTIIKVGFESVKKNGSTTFRSLYINIFPFLVLVSAIPLP